MKIKREKQEKTKKEIAIKFNIIAIIAIIIFSAALCPVTLQNDTYYTIKIGEHIVNTKTVDMMDPFSWHQNLSYQYPHWLYDVFIYVIYALAGFKGIFASTVILSCILGVIMYITNCKISKNKLVSFFITLGAMYLMRGYIAARAQLVTFILLEATILLIEKFLETKKVRYAVGMVVIATLIANIHCAVWPFFFVIFLPYIAEYLVFTILDFAPIYRLRMFYNKFLLKKYNAKNKEEKAKKITEKIELLEKTHNNFENKRIEARNKPYKIRYNKNSACKWLIVIMIVCAFTGLLTPIGDNPYTHLPKLMQGNTTKYISEHLPLTLINNKPMLVVLTALIALMVFTDVKLTLKDLFMLAGLTFLMFMTRRQASMLVLFGSAIVAKMIAQLFEKYDKDGTEKIEDVLTSLLGTAAILSVVVFASVAMIKPKINDKFVDDKTYPVAAAQWIKENLDVNNIRLYNEYNYGSYLIFEGIPVFIDSRADLYAPEFNKQVGDDGRDIFTDYINTSQISTYYENTFEKYQITHVIIYKNSKINMFISRDSKYKELYSDEKFVIYEREN